VSNRNPALVLVLAELRRRGVAVTSATGANNTAVLVVDLSTAPKPPSAPTSCARCDAKLPVREGPGRPRILCDACRRPPLGPRGEREALHLAAVRPRAAGDDYEAHLTKMRREVMRLHGVR
jgi:hypothetical protein